MKRLLLVGIVSILAIPTDAFAQTTNATGVGVANSTSNSAAGAVAISGQGGGGGGANSSLVINSNTPADTTATIRNTPNAYAPGLTAAGLETCLGSVSGGASALGWGAVFGTTIPDPSCVARLDARTLWSMGLKKAAVVRLCLMNDIYRSMPEVCAQYLPRTEYVALTGYTYTQTVIPAANDGPVEVIMQKTGEHRMCQVYDEVKHRCRVWAR